MKNPQDYMKNLRCVQGDPNIQLPVKDFMKNVHTAFDQIGDGRGTTLILNLRMRGLLVTIASQECNITSVEVQGHKS